MISCEGKWKSVPYYNHTRYFFSNNSKLTGKRSHLHMFVGRQVRNNTRHFSSYRYKKALNSLGSLSVLRHSLQTRRAVGSCNNFICYHEPTSSCSLHYVQYVIVLQYNNCPCFILYVMTLK